MNLKRDQERAAWLQAADTPLLEGDFFEQIIRAIYTAILQPGDLAVDCGANVGLHTMPMSNLVGPFGRVLAIEAIPEMAESLAFHTRGGSYTNIEVVPKAIGSREGRATFSWVKGLPGWSGLRQRADLSPGLETSVATIEVPITTLDSLLANSRHRVRFVKMDLEGGEYHALQGAASMLKNHRPLVIFENGREPAARLYGYTREDWFALFEGADFVVFDLFGRPFLPERWHARGIPYYFIAAARGSDDERFVRLELGDVIRTVNRWHQLKRLRHRIRQWTKRRVPEALLRWYLDRRAKG